jgi:aldose 1-epimerase
MGSPTGAQFTITAAGYSATVVEAGGGIRTLTHAGADLVAGYGPTEVITGARGQVLMPWPNRIRDGAYSYAGAAQQLPLSEPKLKNASHGLVRWCSWQPIAVAADRVTLGYRLMAQSGYPWTLALTATYAVSGTGLTVTLSATNESPSPAPFAAGMHPYLTVGQPVDALTLTVPAARRQLVDERLLPTATEPVAGEFDFRDGRPIGTLKLDDAFTSLTRDADGCAVVRLEGSRTVELWLDESWHWVQVFTGDTLSSGAREAVAVEPMTAPADAFNSGSDLIALAPGQTWSGSYGIRTG